MEHFIPTMLDVLDEKGNPTGVSKPFDDVHRDGDWHRGAHVWLVRKNGELLLQRRSKHVSAYPLMWDISASGHIDAGDTSIQTAQKELREELGIDLPQERFECIGTIIEQFVTNNGGFTSNEFDDIYIVWISDSMELQKNDSEVADLNWMHFSDLEKKIIAKDPEYISHETRYKLLFSCLHQKFDKMVV